MPPLAWVESYSNSDSFVSVGHRCIVFNLYRLRGGEGWTYVVSIQTESGSDRIELAVGTSKSLDEAKDDAVTAAKMWIWEANRALS